MLPADVPYFEVHVREGDGRDILAYGRHGFEFGGGVRRQVEGFDLFVESGFAGIVKTEEKDGVFCFYFRVLVLEGDLGGREGQNGPSLLVA